LSTKIRLKRMGAKKRPFYRFVAIDSRRPKSGQFLEQLGQYAPIEKPAAIKIDEERIYYWLDQGAEPSDTVASLFSQIGLTEKYLAKKAGKDVAGMEIKSTITERPKKRKTKKKTE
jgi:small subunit ribosomal protein S16